MTAAMIILICKDHRIYFDSKGHCVLLDLPFPTVVLANRASAGYFEGLGPKVTVQTTRWGDYAHVRADAAALAAARPVFAVGTVNEALMELAAELRAQLGLGGMDGALVERFRNKLVMKQLLSAAGVRVPAYCASGERAAVAALLERHGQLVIKPVDGYGARAVTFVRTAAELEAWYAGHEDVDAYEAEEFIDGSLYHINALVRDRQVLLTAGALYVPGMANIDFASGAPFVSVMIEDDELKPRLTAFSTRVIEVLGLDNGVTHLECFVTGAGEIVLCEIAARPGGGGIVHMIEAQYGVNYCWASLMLQGGCGDLIQLPAPSQDQLFGLMGFRAAANGKIKRIAGPGDFAEPSIRHVQFLAAEGDFVAAAKHCTDFFCLLIFASSSHADFYTRREQLHQRFYAELEMYG